MGVPPRNYMPICNEVVNTAPVDAKAGGCCQGIALRRWDKQQAVRAKRIDHAHEAFGDA